MCKAARSLSESQSPCRAQHMQHRNATETPIAYLAGAEGVVAHLQEEEKPRFADVSATCGGRGVRCSATDPQRLYRRSGQACMGHHSEPELRQAKVYLGLPQSCPYRHRRAGPPQCRGP